MNYSMIVAPIVGAIIGYATNQIAVKMLFRPLKPIKIGNYTLPFTPGIIPKGKPRLAKAIGAVVGGSLLTKDNLKQTLLTDDMKQKVTSALHEGMKTLDSDSRSLKEIAVQASSKEKVEEISEHAILYVTDQIDCQLKKRPIGNFIGEQVVKAIKSSLQGGFLSKLINDSVLAPIGTKISNEVDTYIDEHGKEAIQPIIQEEYEKLSSYQVDEISKKLQAHSDKIEQTVLKLYEVIIDQKLDTVFDTINIANIVETQINQMDVKELETLLMSVMKKELRAIVNLGALIGFILGLINLFF